MLESAKEQETPCDVARRTRREQGLSEQVHVVVDSGVVEVVSDERSAA